jgi:hypothetical protein
MNDLIAGRTPYYFGQDEDRAAWAACWLFGCPGTKISFEQFERWGF